MGKIKRTFDVQFKAQVVQAIQSGTHTVKEICQEHQLQKQTVERWVERYSMGKLVDRPSLREKTLEREVDKLKSKSLFTASGTVTGDFFERPLLSDCTLE